MKVSTTSQDHTVIQVITTDEAGMIGEKATVEVYLNDKLWYEVTAEVTRQKGADGGLYPAVILSGHEHKLE